LTPAHRGPYDLITSSADVVGSFPAMSHQERWRDRPFEASATFPGGKGAKSGGAARLRTM
jgi:hypothetical protein